jgi:MerR family transcriptional regulator, heat shock protein HspR
MSSHYEMSDDSPVYVISVAAQLSGLHPQTLRTYDRLGLVSPGRSAGQGRRYSLRDILLLREVQRLSQQERINLPGIKRILELESEVDQLRGVLAELTAEMGQLRTELESTRSVAARLAGLLRSRGASGSLVPVRRHAAGPAEQPDAGPEPAADKPGSARPAAGTAPGPDPAQPAARSARPAARSADSSARPADPSARVADPSARAADPSARAADSSA